MAFEWKEIITPVATLTAVWLGARFTLRNELRKKTLEIQSEKLELLFTECSNVLKDINRVSLAVLHTLDDFIPTTESEGSVTEQEIQDALRAYREKGVVIDFDAITACQHKLEFHRPKEYQAWIVALIPLLGTLTKMTPYNNMNPIAEADNRKWSHQELTLYRQELDEKRNALPILRKRLTSAMASDYRQLGLSSEPANFWVYVERWKRVVNAFFHKPPTSPLT